MPLPIDLILVRHGESEGNAANKRDRAGDSSLMSSKHLTRHNSEWRLTDAGRKQAKAAGEWIRKNIPGKFDMYLVSPYARAKETAGLMKLIDAKWEVDPYLVERDNGDLDGLTSEEKKRTYHRSLAVRALNEFYWRPPNGETRLDAGLRWDRILQSLQMKHSDHRVIIVAHETLIEAALIRRLHLTVEDFCKWKEENDPKTKIHNCQIIHFTRRNPETGEVIPSVRWYRSICPWNIKISPGKWQEIEKKLFTNNDLLESIEKLPRIIK